MKKVLVDDHAVFRDGVASLLLAWGHEVAAGPGEQEIQLVDAESPQDVLMDVRMLGAQSSTAASGPGKAQSAEVAIVVLTVSKEEADLFRAIKAGAQGHPPPAMGPPRLRSMLEGAARGERAALTGTYRTSLTDEAIDPAAPGGLARLTERELEVLGLVTEGLRNRQIAARMGISENTVKFHLKNVAEKLHAANRAELAARAVRAGLVPRVGREGGSTVGHSGRPGGRSGSTRS